MTVSSSWTSMLTSISWTSMLSMHFLLSYLPVLASTRTPVKILIFYLATSYTDGVCLTILMSIFNRAYAWVMLSEWDSFSVSAIFVQFHCGGRNGHDVALPFPCWTLSDHLPSFHTSCFLILSDLFLNWRADFESPLHWSDKGSWGQCFGNCQSFLGSEEQSNIPVLL